MLIEQDESMLYWYVNAADLGRDGSVVVNACDGDGNSALFKLDANGAFKWKTQVTTLFWSSTSMG